MNFSIGFSYHLFQSFILLPISTFSDINFYYIERLKYEREKYGEETKRDISRSSGGRTL